MTHPIRIGLYGLALLFSPSLPLNAAEPLPTPVAKPLPGGWNLRTGVFPLQEATADIAKGVLTISGGGGRGTWRRGTVVEADRARMTAAFVYKAFKGDFILTARRIGFDKKDAHGNSGSGLAAIGDLKGWDAPQATNDSNYGGKPLWYRLIRKGDRVGLYEGPDGQKWQASNSGALIPGTVYAGIYTDSYSSSEKNTTAQYDNVTVEENPKFTYSTTWLGNDFEGGSRNTVGASMIGLAVAADGTCITTGKNGEQENEMGRYRDGQTLNVHPPNRVGASGNALVLLPDGSGFVAKAKDLRRIDWNRQNGQHGDAIPVAAKGGELAIRGLAVFGDEVFAACRDDAAIVVLDLKTMKPKRSLPFERPGPLAVDAKGVLWVVEEGWTSGHPYSYPYPEPFRILGLDRETGKQVSEITGVELPTAITADAHGPSKSRLLIADNGKDQQVKIFDVGGAKPKLAGVLGAKGGVFAGTPGEMKPGKFNGLTGVGSDAKGNIYVAGAGYPYRVAIPAGMPNISQLKAFAPTAINKPEPEALWVLTCPGFNVMGASWDAKTGDAYIGGLARYAYDATRPLGKEWQIAGTTANLRDDSDGESLLRTFQAAPRIHWLDGERFLTLRERMYKLDANGNLGKLVRITNFNDKTIREQKDMILKGAADPFSQDALVGRFPLNLPDPTFKDNNQKDWLFWEWVDGQGGSPLDGKQQREEYHDLTPLITAREGGHVGFSRDSANNWWIAGLSKRDIQCRPYAGLKNGVPTWSDEMRSFPIPEVMSNLIRVHYDPERDIMDLIGQTSENPGGYLQIGEIIRFTNWSTKPVMGTRLTFVEIGVSVPWGGEGFWETGHHIDKVVGVDIAGDVVYATNRTGAIRAYDMNKGNMIEWMDAGPEVFAGSGFFDWTDTALQAYEVSKSEHLILRQSNWTVRILAHRWNPFNCNNGHLPPAPKPWARPQDGKVELLWGGRTGPAGTVKGYKIYRSDSEKGPYAPLGGLVESSSYVDSLPNGTAKWYKVATVNLVGEGPQSKPIHAGAAAPGATLRVSAGKSGADGLDITTRGNWQGVYGSAGVYLACDNLKKNADETLRRYSTDPNMRVQWPGFARYGGEPAASDDPDRLQSVFPGLRTGKGGYYNGNSAIDILDGRPRLLTIAMKSGGKKQIIFSDPDSGAVILDQAVPVPTGTPQTVHMSFVINGRVQIEFKGEPFYGFFIDPAPAR